MGVVEMLADMLLTRRSWQVIMMMLIKIMIFNK
jgi:hypothetical protein